MFSDKEKVPVILKALSTETVFHRTLSFGFAGKDSAGISESGAGKKKLPAIAVFNKGKKEWYKGKDISFSALYEWINLHSESGMGD